MTKRLRTAAAGLLLITSISAIYAAIAFISDPSGAALGMTTEELVHSPFHNFLIPGIVLLIINGILPVIILILMLLRYTYYPQLILFQGVLLSAWIIIQVVMLRDLHIMHVIMITFGISLSLIGISLIHSSKPLGYSKS